MAAEEVNWAPGADVICYGKRGVVRFVGETQFAQGTWVGVEFRSEAAGKNDGSVQGVRYFGPTSPNHGIFLKHNSASIEPYNQDVACAIKIQSMVRAHQARENMRYTVAVKAINEMESKAECDRLRDNLNCARASDIIDEDNWEHERSAPQRSPSPPLSVRTEKCSTVFNEVIANSPEVPTLEFIPQQGGTFSIPRDTVEQVLRHFKRDNNKHLKAGEVLRLIRLGIEVVRREVQCALLEISTPPAPGRLCVLGDTHGQLADVMWLFFEHGEPSSSNVYLFNGDVCDRGDKAVEIMIIILLFKLMNPACVHMNRGNHEDASMNEFYGFHDECIDKWGQVMGEEIFDNFNVFFQHLPLYTMIDNSVFVIHGGLWRQTFGLSQLRRVEFRRPTPEAPGKGLEILNYDSLWSDPQDCKGIGSNSRGDNIISFGDDITRKFLRTNKLRLLIRSHQVPNLGQGYEWHHHNKCVTIFSASNYCGECGNLGGIMVLARGEEDHIYEHWAPSLEELVEMEAEADRAQARIAGQAKGLSSSKKKRREARARMEADIVKRVQELVLRNKTQLYEYWEAADDSPLGMFRIPAAMWREGCAAILDDDLPWVRLQEVMGVADENGQVHYIKFLTRYRVAFDAKYGACAGGWERAVWTKLMETLLRADLPLREALAALDATNDGIVSSVEFARLLESCRVGISTVQAKTLLRSVASGGAAAGEDDPLSVTHKSSLNTTLGGGKRVSVWDVLGRLQVTLPLVSHSDAEEAEWAIPKLRPMAAAVLDDARRRLMPPGSRRSEWPVSKLLAAWFEDVDKSQNGFLEPEEFISAMSMIGPALERGGCPADHDSLHRLAKYFDVVGNGRINYFELLNSLTWEDSLGSELREDLLETINAAMYFNVAPIRRSLQKLDPEKCGRVTPSDFVQALRAVHTALSAGRGEEGSRFTRGQIDTIVDHLPREHDQRVDYERFLASFRVVDTMEQTQ